MLRQQALQSHSANVDMISGATYTSEAFVQSLQEALAEGEQGLSRCAVVAPGLRRVEHVMGMPVIVDVRDEHVGDDAIDEVFDWFRRGRRDGSARSSPTARSAGSTAASSRSRTRTRTFAPCSHAASELADETGGYFDVRAAASRRLDPSGLVKGWAVDRAAAILDAAGATNYASTPAATSASAAARCPSDVWRVGIQHPLERDRVAAVVETRDLAVATSGAYERGEHVIDPHTGRPPTGVLSVTITGPDLATADAYATTAFAMGRTRARSGRRDLAGYEAMTILADGHVLFTRGFPAAVD